VFVLYGTLTISYLWYNVIGCASCLLFATTIQTFLPRNRPMNTDVQVS